MSMQRQAIDSHLSTCQKNHTLLMKELQNVQKSVIKGFKRVLDQAFIDRDKPVTKLEWKRYISFILLTLKWL